MLTIKNIANRLLDNIIVVSSVSQTQWSFDKSIWKIVDVKETDFNYKIDVVETNTNKECRFSLLRNKHTHFDRYILYTSMQGKGIKHIPITTETLSTPKDFLFQLECSLISILSPV